MKDNPRLCTTRRAHIFVSSTPPRARDPSCCPIWPSIATCPGTNVSVPTYAAEAPMTHFYKQWKKTNGFKVCGRRVSDNNRGFWKLLGLMCASLSSGTPKWQQLSSMWRWNSLRGHKAVLNEDISPQSALAVLVKRWQGWENCKLRSVFCVTANQTLACCRHNIQSSCYMKPLNYIFELLRDHRGVFHRNIEAPGSLIYHSSPQQWCWA